MQEAPALRPLSVGDIIDRVLRLVRANLVLFVGIALLPDLVVEILQRATGLSQTFDLNDLGAALNPAGGGTVAQRPFVLVNSGAAVAVVILGVAISIVQAGALIEAIGQRYLGRPITVRDAYARGLRAVPRLLLCGAVVGLAFILLVLLVIAAVAATNAASVAAIAVVIGLIALFFVFPWALLSLAVVGPALVLEGLGPIAAIRRSFHLIDRARLRTLGLYVLMAIISSILGLIFGVIFLVSFVADPTVRAVLQTIANVASAAVSGPLIYGALVVLYYDLRVRKEALDLQLAAEALPREA
jgi:MFS family permease